MRRAKAGDKKSWPRRRKRSSLLAPCRSAKFSLFAQPPEKETRPRDQQGGQKNRHNYLFRVAPPRHGDLDVGVYCAGTGARARGGAAAVVPAGAGGGGRRLRRGGGRGVGQRNARPEVEVGSGRVALPRLRGVVPM